MKTTLLLWILFIVVDVNGQNLHNQANAASIANESNSTLGWTGNAILVSSTNNPFLGNFSMSLSSSSTNGRDCGYTFTAIIGQIYDISIWARAGTQNFQPAFANWSGFAGFNTTVINSQNWVQYNWTLTANNTAPLIRIYTSPSSGGSAGDTVFFDSVSITLSGGGGGDTLPPTAVTTLAASNTTASSTNLNWTASTDNVGVTGYNIFQNGGLIGTPSNTVFNVTGLNPSTSYSFNAFARDAAGNISTAGNTVNITTLAGGGFTDYTSLNANLFTVDWRARDLFVNRNVGIGTINTQGYSLAVAGNIVAEEIKVELQSAWPDFVFKNGYRLPSLLDVEKHINEKGHLLNIPNSQEIDENGIVLGEMMAKLLQKIEELTLYAIQHDKTINQLTSEVDQINRIVKPKY